MSAEKDALSASVGLPILTRHARGYSVGMTERGPATGLIERGPNMHGWGWTVGFGWHTGLPSLGAALDALLADPAFGLDVHGTYKAEGGQP